MEQIRWVLNQMPRDDDRWLSLMAPAQIRPVQAFHESLPGYSPTPLHDLQAAARALGLGSLFVKDESLRFGLNAFKVLGGSYAIARVAAEQSGMEQLTYQQLTGPAVKAKLGQAVFYTATDGNHGRGVAWAANRLGLRAVVRMPAGTVQSRLQNIRKEGAEVTVESLNYDDCVRLAAKEAAACPGGILVQDTAWEGYEQVPCRIMQGYGTMLAEIAAQLEGEGPPTHVFIQAGVGSLAGAVAGYLVCRYPDAPPKVVVVEASAADCHYRSALRGDGQICTVKGDLDTMMAGLACGEPNPVSWSILRNHAAAFVSCPDWVSAEGMRLLAKPLGSDAAMISGESGAVGMGLAAAVMKLPEYRSLRGALGLSEHSRLLLISTEGDTDPINYRCVLQQENLIKL